MKRGRNSTLPKTQLSIIDILPSTLFVEILLKLPVRTILICKSVCKTWHGFVSDPNFAKLHSARARPSCALIRGVDDFKFSRSLYFLEPGDSGGFDSGYCRCKARSERCGSCRFDSEVKFKLKIPLRNAQAMLDSPADAVFCLRTTRKCKNLIQLKSRYDHCYNVVNSCNGFVCLLEPVVVSDTILSPVCVCNPVTGEFSYLPWGCCYGNGDKLVRGIGFGFSPKHDQYKVIRISSKWKNDPDAGIGSYRAVAAEIYILGTDSWRSLDISGLDIPAINSPSYFNGALYWTYLETSQHYRVASFDLDNEQFHAHSIPSQPLQQGLLALLAIVVLGGHLFVYTSGAYTHVDIWLVNEFGVSLSWTLLFSIDVSELHDPHHWFPYQLLCCLDGEAALLFGGPRDEFMYYDRSEGLRFKQPKFRGLKSDFDAIAFTPSFVSLKDVVIAGNMEVLNVNSGCGKIKLLEETHPLLLGKARN